MANSLQKFSQSKPYPNICLDNMILSSEVNTLGKTMENQVSFCNREGTEEEAKGVLESTSKILQWVFAPLIRKMARTDNESCSGAQAQEEQSSKQNSNDPSANSGRSNLSERATLENDWQNLPDKFNQALRYGRLKLMANDVKEISESLKIGGSLYGLKYLWFSGSFDHSDANHREIEEYIKDIIRYEFCSLQELYIPHNSFDDECCGRIRECMQQHNMSLHCMRIDGLDGLIETDLDLNKNNHKLKETRDKLRDHRAVLKLLETISKKYHIPAKNHATDIVRYEATSSGCAQSCLNGRYRRIEIQRNLEKEVQFLKAQCKILLDSSFFGEYLYSEDLL